LGRRPTGYSRAVYQQFRRAANDLCHADADANANANANADAHT
jgi:hypothetical protein